MYFSDDLLKEAVLALKKTQQFVRLYIELEWGRQSRRKTQENGFSWVSVRMRIRIRFLCGNYEGWNRTRINPTSVQLDEDYQSI